MGGLASLYGLGISCAADARIFFGYAEGMSLCLTGLMLAHILMTIESTGLQAVAAVAGMIFF